jgi:transposase
MQLQTILNRVEKHRSFVYDRVRLIEEGGSARVEVEVRARKNSRARCSSCGRGAPGYDRLAPRRFEFVPLWGITVYLLYAMRRVSCPSCGVKVEAVPWASGKSGLTRSYAWFLARWARRLSWSEVAQVFHTSWEKVFRSVEMAVQWGRAHQVLEGIEAIGIDEIQWQRGHRYLTLVYQLDQGTRRLLWVGQQRRVKTLLRFFRWFGAQRSAQLRFICSDMWQPYLKVIAKKASAAVHVLDRYHIMAKMSKAIDQVRAQEAKRLAAQGYEPVLTGSRWLLLKRPENLSEKQELRLAELVQYNLKTVRAYLLKEDFQSLWRYVSPTWAGKFLDRWCTRTMRSKIEPMKKMARTVRSHRALILNWFRARGEISSGAVEGFNNKAKLTMRKAYGFRTYRAIEVALYHALANLPEPESTHRFC